MRYGLYTIEDVIARRHIHIFSEDNDATAMRTFRKWCDQVGSDAKDFRLWRAATWDIYSGELDVEIAPYVVVEGGN